MTVVPSHSRQRRWLARSVVTAVMAASPAFAGAAAAAATPAGSAQPPAAANGMSMPSAGATGSATADRHGVPAVALAWADAWNSGDPERLAALFTRDGTYQDFAFGATFVGRAEIASWVSTTSASINDAHIQITDAFRAQNRVSIRWIFSGHITGAPMPFSVPATTVMELQRGHISYNGDYYNLADLLRQSGLPAEQPAPAPVG